MKKNKVCHITTVHPLSDTRIFHKECTSLSEAGFEVYLIVQHNKKETINNINIHPLPSPKNRKDRILNLTKSAYKKALETNAEIYHFHDPELIPLGIKLRKIGKKVIYDVHEDVPRQIMSKPYLNKFTKPFISKSFEIYENWASKKFNYIIAATPHIRNRFLKINKNTVDINNFPRLNELFEPVDWKFRKNEICYIGGISRIRGIIELVKALEYVDTTLHLAGNFESEKLKKEVMSLQGWKRVKYYGFVNREKVKDILKQIKIGMVTLHPTINYLDSLPVKMFEYMSAGIPVVGSNFPLWKDILEKNKCGVCINPLDPKEIANAINYLLSNNEVAKEFGKNARNLIKNKYNWESEEKKLIRLYKNLLNLKE